MIFPYLDSVHCTALEKAICTPLTIAKNVTACFFDQMMLPNSRFERTDAWFVHLISTLLSDEFYFNWIANKFYSLYSSIIINQYPLLFKKKNELKTNFKIIANFQSDPAKIVWNTDIVKEKQEWR